MKKRTVRYYHPPVTLVVLYTKSRDASVYIAIRVEGQRRRY